jgi:hypothetical protein
MAGEKAASSSMPLTSTMRGWPPITVPAKARLPLVGGDGDAHQAVIDRAVVLAAFRNGDAAFLGHRRGGDHVDLGQHRPQHAGQGGGGQRLDVEVADLALVGDVDGLDAEVDHLAGQGADLLGQGHEGLQLRGFFGGDRGAVQGVGHRAGQQVVADLLGDLQGHVFLGLVGAGAQVRGGHHAVRTEQRVFLGRLGDEDVEAGAADMAAVEQLAQGGFIDQAAAGAVDDQHALLGLGQGSADRMLRVLSVSGVCRVMTSARASSSSSSTFSTPISTARSAQEGVVGDDLHLQAQSAVGDDAADVAGADQAEGLGVELHAHEAVLLPLAGLGGDVGGGQLAGQGEHHGDGVLGGGDRVAERGVHHDDALGRGRRDVDIVDADAGAGDDLQLAGGGDDVLVELGARADGDAVIVADHGDQLFLGQAGLGVGFDAAGP